MTKAEVADMHERVMAKITSGRAMRYRKPISDAGRARFEELKRERIAEELVKEAQELDMGY